MIKGFDDTTNSAGMTSNDTIAAASIALFAATVGKQTKENSYVSYKDRQTDEQRENQMDSQKASQTD